MALVLNEYLKNPPAAKVELCGCGCGDRLEKNDPLGPRPMTINGKKVIVNEDCYFDKISELIDEHPIGGLGIHGPKTSTLDD